MQLHLAIIEHEEAGTPIHQRASDGFVNATALCKAAGKTVHDYIRLNSTTEFLNALSLDTGIPVSSLTITFKGTPAELQGTWVHPKVAIHLGQWCSPKFAVAVANWVYEWMVGNIKGKMPVHLQRYISNRAAIPKTHFSMLNEITFALVAPLEDQGYTLPETMVPDISTGRMFSDWLREQGHDPSTMPTYTHVYTDGRKVDARLYPNEFLPAFREFFYNTWLPNRATSYFKERDDTALQFLPALLPGPEVKPIELR